MMKIVIWFISPMEGAPFPIPRIVIIIICVLVLWLDSRLLL